MNASPTRISHTRNVGKRDQQLILLLISEVLLYVCTNLLYSINITYAAVTADHLKTVERIRIESFIAYLSTPFLILINNCLPFYVYFTVSSKFRKDVQHFFTFYSRARAIAPVPLNHPTITQ